MKVLEYERKLRAILAKIVKSKHIIGTETAKKVLSKVTIPDVKNLA